MPGPASKDGLVFALIRPQNSGAGPSALEDWEHPEASTASVNRLLSLWLTSRPRLSPAFQALRPNLLSTSSFFFFFCRGTRDLSSPTGMETVPPAMEAWSLNHWTAREVLSSSLVSLFSSLSFSWAYMGAWLQR